MHLADLQDCTAHIASLAWPHDAPGIDLGDSLVARLAEETGEVARAVRKYGRERWGHRGEGAGTATDVEDELGDVLFVAARIADLCGVSLRMAAERAVSKFGRRLQQNGGEGR